MTHSTKRILFFFIATILQVQAFSQKDIALSLYNSGQSSIKTNPDKAFQLLEKAMKLSSDNKDWELYIKSLNALAPFNLEREVKLDTIFQWLKQSFKNLKSRKQDDQLAQLHFNIAEYYNRITVEVDTPIFHYQQAKKIWTNLKGEWSEEVSHCYHGLGNIYKYQ